MIDSDIEHGKLLNGKQGGHIDAPTEADVDAFVQGASDVGDAATDIGRMIAELAQSGVRPMGKP